MALENSKHEQFCQGLWLETGKQRQKPIEYHTQDSLKWKDDTVHNKASASIKTGTGFG